MLQVYCFFIVFYVNSFYLISFLYIIIGKDEIPLPIKSISSFSPLNDVSFIQKVYGIHNFSVVSESPKTSKIDIQTIISIILIAFRNIGLFVLCKYLFYSL